MLTPQAAPWSHTSHLIDLYRGQNGKEYNNNINIHKHTYTHI